MRRRRTEVAEGQRFRKLGTGAGIWEVTAVGGQAGGPVHVRLRRVDDPNTVKTLAAAVLADTRQFVPVEEG